jgi:hypothetical protein
VLRRRWELCNTEGLIHPAQEGIEIQGNRYAILERDASGALIPRPGPEFQGTVACTVVPGQTVASVECGFLSDLGRTVEATAYIIGPSPYMLIFVRGGKGFSGLHHYAAGDP